MPQYMYQLGVAVLAYAPHALAAGTTLYHNDLQADLNVLSTHTEEHQNISQAALDRSSLMRSEMQLAKESRLEPDAPSMPPAPMPRPHLVSRTESASLLEGGANYTPGDVSLGWRPCEWQSMEGTGDNFMRCNDMYRCDPEIEGWTCCATHKGRKICPKTYPRMCNEKSCPGLDHCCAKDCGTLDGERECFIEQKVYSMENGWLTFRTRDHSGEVLEDWTDLYSGPMTWEIWYAKTEQTADNTIDKGNAIFATYGDNHNTYYYADATESPGRRRNIGVYIQPDDGTLSISTFVGKDTIHEHIVSGPQIVDTNWHHIAAVWDKDEGKGWLYLDGQRYNTYVLYQPGDENPGLEGQLVIGGGHLGRTTAHMVSQFRIWGIPLKDHHVKTIFTCGSPALPESNLKANYPLHEDFVNDANTGYPTLKRKNTGQFVEAQPCIAAKPGPTGAHGQMGPPGKKGPMGGPGIDGPQGVLYGIPGRHGPNGTKGPKGMWPVPAHIMLLDATKYEYYGCFLLCIVATYFGFFMMNREFIEGKHWTDWDCLRRKRGGGGGKAGEDGEEEDWGEEATEAEGGG